jgi:hypothetical protein
LLSISLVAEVGVCADSKYSIFEFYTNYLEIFLLSNFVIAKKNDINLEYIYDYDTLLILQKYKQAFKNQANKIPVLNNIFRIKK